ncbi:hypothetical protein KIV40_01775 [Vibrio sp. D173a]|uniref:transposase DNA-binding-containing protein n=1 Tax=Vibrio sp. D173a TaxID=2836349 RepID=UPI00255342F7|nr:transposase DNA-binding-containing protein [Vibrio sp. D173a]MDK9754194.1 hypothetical protein [Vibrio sp. D173a]
MTYSYAKHWAQEQCEQAQLQDLRRQRLINLATSITNQPKVSGALIARTTQY